MTDNVQPLPAPPRPIGARARRRAWAEAPVRVWMVLTVLVGASLISLAAQSIKAGLTERRVINNGRPTTATILEVNGDGDPRHAVKWDGDPGDRNVKLQYPGASTSAAPRRLESKQNNGRRPGQAIEVRVDPDHPDVWTDRTEPEPWVARLVIVWMLLPALLITLAMMLLRRQQMLSIWRDGAPTGATVVDIRQSAIAPKSRVIRFTLHEDSDRRIFSTFFPVSAGAVQKGDELLLLTSQNRNRAIVAELYEELGD